jgi:hypothetical protein
MPRKGVHSIPRPAIPEGWCFTVEASRILNVHTSAVNDPVVRYDVPYRKVQGWVIYHIDSLKLVAKEIEAIRASKKDKRYRQPQETSNA